MHFDLADLRLFIHIAESPSLTQGARRAFFPRPPPARGSRRSKASLAAACCIATAAASN